MNVTRLLATEEREPCERWVRAQAQTAYLGDQVALCRVLGTFFCEVPTEDRSLAPYLMLDGFWEMWITQAVARHVKPGMTCVDVGACFGYYTLLLADLVGPTGHVLAYEPNPACVTHIQHSLALNGFTERVTVRATAVGSAAQSSAVLRLSSDRWGDSSLVDTGYSGLRVRVAALDAELSDQKRVGFIKIDAEGSEPEIWMGMQATLARDNPLVFMEFAARNLKDPEALLGLIGSSGYELAIVDEAGLRRPTTRDYLLGDGEIRTLWLQRE